MRHKYSYKSFNDDLNDIIIYEAKAVPNFNPIASYPKSNWFVAVKIALKPFLSFNGPMIG